VFAITGLISILWVIYGYSIAFDTTGMEQGVVNFNSFFGGMGKAFLAGVTPASITGPAACFRKRCSSPSR
jgi:Amt family ammonium transporter